jgi:hypothetical protein
MLWPILIWLVVACILFAASTMPEGESVYPSGYTLARDDKPYEGALELSLLAALWPIWVGGAAIALAWLSIRALGASSAVAAYSRPSNADERRAIPNADERRAILRDLDYSAGSSQAP